MPIDMVITFTLVHKITIQDDKVLEWYNTDNVDEIKALEMENIEDNAMMFLEEANLTETKLDVVKY